MATTETTSDLSAEVAEFERDGVTVLRGALDPREMTLLEDAWESHFHSAKHIAEVMYGDGKDQIHFLTENTIRNHPRYQTLMRETRIPDIASQLFGGHDVYYYLEQMWNKTGGSRRTAWHQDTSYLPFSGPGFLILWIPLEDLAAENVLEVVRGSHKQTLYNASMYDPTDFTAPLYDERDLPRLPDIEANRQDWDILSTPMARGDVLAFHPGCLHGGAPTRPGQNRRSYTFRFFSDEAYYSPLPAKRDLGVNKFSNQRQDTDDRVVLAGFEELVPGQPIYQAGHWARIRPWDL